jgi:hypothetical protein
MSTIDQQLQSILSTAVARRNTPIQQASEKTASAITSYSNQESRSLVKIAAILKQTEVEPSYRDLYTFIGGLYGNR